MHVLVAYASRHGATQGIAERIAETLRSNGLDVDARSAAEVKDVAAYDAFVVGSAAYMFHWMKEAKEFVERNRAMLTSRPVWLFSSGPLGTEPFNDEGVDQKIAARPKETDDLVAASGARDFHVFFGAYDPDQPPIGLAERLGGWFLGHMPAARDALPSGDFRDWPEIDAWATGIARDLQGAPAVVG